MHNVVIDIEGWISGAHFGAVHTGSDEKMDSGENDPPIDNEVDVAVEEDHPEWKRHQLVEEIVAAKELGLVR